MYVLDESLRENDTLYGVVFDVECGNIIRMINMFVMSLKYTHINIGKTSLSDMKQTPPTHTSVCRCGSKFRIVFSNWRVEKDKLQ